jgi:lipoic acid synthetase
MRKMLSWRPFVDQLEVGVTNTIQDGPSKDSSSKTTDLHIGKPAWLKSPIPTGSTFFNIKRDLRDRKLFTVCEEAKCPNIGECWNTNTATFMVMGDTCTRGCRFCNVKTGNPNGWLDENEPMNTANSARMMNLKYVVITMVDRDDLMDGGAAHVGKVLAQVREQNPGIVIEVLVGDFRGVETSIQEMLKARPEVYGHNIETVERLSPRVRDRRADYRVSLRTLQSAKDLADYPVLTKSAIMLGLGESLDEVKASMRDLRHHGVDFVAIGQYLRPTKKHLSIKSYVHPDDFKRLEEYGYEIGFQSVASAPLVRSSYRAREFYELAVERRNQIG